VEDNVDWTIQSKDRNFSDITHHATEDDFLAALKALFSDPKKQFVSATLSDGTVLDEASARALLGAAFTIGASGIGQAPIG